MAFHSYLGDPSSMSTAEALPALVRQLQWWCSRSTRAYLPLTFQIRFGGAQVQYTLAPNAVVTFRWQL